MGAVTGDDARSRISHLLRRAGFGPTPAELDAAASDGYDATVDRLVDFSVPDRGADAVAAPTFTPPVAASALPADPAARREAQEAERRAQRTESQRMSQWWIDRMVASTTPLRERLTLFWHGHFATSLQKVREPELMFRQNEIFRRMGAGNFEDLTQAVSKDPAMLLWLDSNQNRRQSPNENFARELFELFTVGIGNYTEVDIREAARAFTGWQYQRAADTFRVVANLHDTGPKTVFGVSGNLGGEDVIRLASAQPATAPFMVARLWSHFARPVGVGDPVVRDLAPAFARDLDVGRLMGAMLRHPEFGSAAVRGGLVKEPIVYVAGTLRAFGLRAASPGASTLPTLNNLGQQPFVPPNVGGWPQNGYWLTTTFALSRLRFASTLVQRADLSAVAGVGVGERPSAAARLLAVDGWGPATAAALAKVADDPKSLMTLALVAPEYLLA
ncbi:MAG: DUF1800 domain-containing protein [Acidimicrobiales bacterium]